jgi:hypothetical protein
MYQLLQSHIQMSSPCEKFFQAAETGRYVFGGLDVMDVLADYLATLDVRGALRAIAKFARVILRRRSSGLVYLACSGADDVPTNHGARVVGGHSRAVQISETAGCL